MRIEYIKFSGKVRDTETVVEMEFVNGVLTEVKLEVTEEYGLVEALKLECRKAEYNWVYETVEKCYDMVLDLAERLLPEFKTIRITHRIERRGEI